jgi:cytochrome c553
MNKLILFSAATLVAATTSIPAADVKANWEKHCLKCHGPDGKGETKLGKKSEVKDLTDSKVQASFTDEKAIKGVKEGIKEGDKIKMKPAEGLTDDEIKALIAYVRTLKK